MGNSKIEDSYHSIGQETYATHRRHLQTVTDRQHSTMGRLADSENRIDLGFALGPDAGLTMWTNGVTKYTTRCKMIASAAIAPALAVSLYNARALYCLTFVAQIFPPEDWILKLENYDYEYLETTRASSHY